MKTIAQQTPQVITIFVPVFGTPQIKLRQLSLTDDWVLDCQHADEKYGIWFTTAEQAIELIGDFYSLEVSNDSN